MTAIAIAVPGGATRQAHSLTSRLVAVLMVTLALFAVTATPVVETVVPDRVS